MLLFSCTYNTIYHDFKYINIYIYIHIEKDDKCHQRDPLKINAFYHATIDKRKQQIHIKINKHGTDEVLSHNVQCINNNI